jgi:putative transposase
MEYKSKISSQYKSSTHHKYSCSYHVILVCKYRKKLLQKQTNKDIQELILEYCDKHNVDIRAIESDIDHIHILVDCDTKVEPHKFISYMKQHTTYYIWKRQEVLLSKQFWKERTFWSDGYFCCTVGNATLEKIQEYINNQG